MSAPGNNHCHSRTRRRFIVYCISLVGLYPLFRFLSFHIPRKPEVIEVSKVIVPGDCHTGADFILFDDGVEAWAISRRCTHLGCKVNYHERGKFIECPCHQSRFSIYGEVLHGPAKKELTRYEVDRKNDSGGYIVTIT